MSKAVILHDIKHIIIDNLQFMIGDQCANSMDKLEDFFQVKLWLGVDLFIENCL